jgi:hypothetical protein
MPRGQVANMPVCTVNYQPPYLMPRLLRWPMQGTVVTAIQNAALGWPPWTPPHWQQQQLDLVSEWLFGPATCRPMSASAVCVRAVRAQAHCAIT